jgi:DNA-binding NtrC family response regulator
VSKKILVIDDEPEFRSTLKDVLESKGYEVEGSPYLATSVGWGLSGDYDLITIDLKMPEMNGIDVARLYSSMIPDTNLLVISGYLDKDSVESLEDMGVRHTLAKPVGISDLLKAVGDALDSSAVSDMAVSNDANGHFLND